MPRKRLNGILLLEGILLIKLLAREASAHAQKRKSLTLLKEDIAAVQKASRSHK
jgi:hypothetical protein